MNFGGGNTSAKIEERDPLTGERHVVLWVKGSGGDLGSASLEGFVSLYSTGCSGLKSRYRDSSTKTRCRGTFRAVSSISIRGRAASIRPPRLHSPPPHRSHARQRAPRDRPRAERRELMARIFAVSSAWIPGQRPGFDLGLKVGEVTSGNPNLQGLILGGHGAIRGARPPARAMIDPPDHSAGGRLARRAREAGAVRACRGAAARSAGAATPAAQVAPVLRGWSARSPRK